MERPSFLIYTPGSREWTGGHVVLHVLAKKLADRGLRVWITSPAMFKGNITVLEKIKTGDETGEVEEFNLTPLHKVKNLYVVYPESIEGNPLKIHNVIRWILYYVKDEIKDSWSKNDILFFLAPAFTKGLQKPEGGFRFLETMDLKFDIFTNKGYGGQRNGYCHVRKKSFPRDEAHFAHHGSKDLSDFMEQGGFKYLADQFNRAEYFLSYDHATFYTLAAALCGCRVVIVNPNPVISPIKFRRKFPSQMYGVAYGWMDLKHADLTRDLVKPYLQEFEKKNDKLINDFIDYISYV